VDRIEAGIILVPPAHNFFMNEIFIC